MPSNVDRNQVQQLLKEGAQLLDVLGAKEFEASHLAGARNIPLAKLAAEAPLRLDRSQGVVTYCYDAL